MERVTAEDLLGLARRADMAGQPGVADSLYNAAATAFCLEVPGLPARSRTALEERDPYEYRLRAAREHADRFCLFDTP
jgi:hypothetical protein